MKQKFLIYMRHEKAFRKAQSNYQHARFHLFQRSLLRTLTALMDDWGKRKGGVT